MRYLHLSSSGEGGQDAPPLVTLEISLDISAYLRGERTRVTLKHVSPTGCLVESPVALANESIHQLRFTASDGTVMTTLGRVTQCRRPVLGPQTHWIVAFTFTHADHPLVRAQINALLATGRANRAAA